MTHALFTVVGVAVVGGSLYALVRGPASWPAGAAVLALVLLVSRAWYGLVQAPPDREMGNVQRIMYVHVPAQSMALMAVTLNFLCSVAYLFRPSWPKDALAEASAEVGLFFGAVGLVLGSIWGKPTWGVYWSWDPRLTSEAILLVGVRRLPCAEALHRRRRATRGVVGGGGHHHRRRHPHHLVQRALVEARTRSQSSPNTVDPDMVRALRWNAFAFLALWLVFLSTRYLIARARTEREMAPPPMVAEAAT